MACHHHFGGYTTFDMHLTDGQHRDPESITHREAGERLIFGLETPLGTIWQRARSGAEAA